MAGKWSVGFVIKMTALRKPIGRGRLEAAVNLVQGAGAANAVSAYMAIGHCVVCNIVGVGVLL